MPNRAYERGRRFEWQRKRHWEDEGYMVLRTAGSHGPFDLVAVRPGEPPLLIQCKLLKDGGEKQGYMIERKFLQDPPLAVSYAYRQLIEVWCGASKTLISEAI